MLTSALYGKCLSFVENLEIEELIFKFKQIEFVGLLTFYVAKLKLPPFVSPLFFFGIITYYPPLDWLNFTLPFVV